MEHLRMRYQDEFLPMVSFHYTQNLLAYPFARYGSASYPEAYRHDFQGNDTQLPIYNLIQALCGIYFC